MRFIKIGKKLKFSPLVAALAMTAFNPVIALAEESIGAFYGDFRLRFETVSQNNALADADALTLRSRVGYKTETTNGFSAVLEIENSFSLIDDFSVPPAGVRTGEFSVIADPETTEVDQAYLKYSGNGLSAKLGRQVITLDGHRFVGHVGWRQDRQTFDGLTVTYKASDDFVINASYIAKRNRIFADEADLDSEDQLLNLSYKTPIGKVVGYAYLLEVDNNTDNSLDTIGISLTGSKEAYERVFSYAAEYASQDANDTFDTDYLLLEGGTAIGGIKAKIGYEVLGSDDGRKGFATPLATLHKFNGWNDQFVGTPNAGLEDLYFSVAGKALGGKWLAIYHDFSADVALAAADDLGDEINLQYTRKFTDILSGGVKLANYSAGDAAFNKVDTDKFWIWAGAKF